MRVKRSVLGLALVGGAFVLLWQQIESVRVGYELERVRAAGRKQSERNAYLRMELQRKASPEWLEAAARRLRMEPPTPEALRLLGGAGERPVRAAAAPVPRPDRG